MTTTAQSLSSVTRAVARGRAVCAHCGAPADEVAGGGEAFCCSGCAGAYALIKGLGLERYYAMRDVAGSSQPVAGEAVDWVDFVQTDGDGNGRAELLVEGLHCAACLWLIERALRAQPDIIQAQLSASTRRLTLAWKGNAARINALADLVARLGYRCLPITADAVERAGSTEERSLLRAMGVAGFAAANIMLLSISVWSGAAGSMGAATRDLFHVISALIAVPAVAFAGRPFFHSAWAALRQGHTNMDVPISIGVVLALTVSLFELLRSGPHAYFDAAVMLLFFLLVGRYLDMRARGYARRTAQQLVAWMARPATVLTASGPVQRPAHRLAVGDRILVAAGERIPVDGEVLEGKSAADLSLINGESLPQPIAAGAAVFAGTTNLDAPLTLRATAVGGSTMLGEIARLMEAAERGRGRYVLLAERVARWYAPVVHLTAFVSFIAWFFIGHLAWPDALLIAASVLIITCPCALALAVPVVQVIASSRLMRRGILLKSPTALERAAAVDTIVFDKTGTLTLGQPRLQPEEEGDREALQMAASMAARSRHPLCKALLEAAPTVPPCPDVEEMPGQGLLLRGHDGDVRLGHARFAGVSAAASDEFSELWLTRPGLPPCRFRFSDSLREDAMGVVSQLRDKGYRLRIISGDRPAVVGRTAKILGIEEWSAEVDPRGKADAIDRLKREGRRVLMVGDGLNDAVALAAADASLSPSSGLDVAQNAADAVFQGGRLAAVADFLGVARRSQALAKQNLVLALVYNLFAVPLAIMGMVTPLLAAIAMSFSSIVVVLNALRLGSALRRRTA